MIDVQEPSLNTLLNLYLFALAALGFASLFPWPLKGGQNSWTLWLPAPALLIYFAYEALMPPRMNIRFDLMVIYPILALTLIAWLFRLWWRRRS